MRRGDKRAVIGRIKAQPVASVRKLIWVHENDGLAIGQISGRDVLFVAGLASFWLVDEFLREQQ
jgi:hypothetical protein